MRRDGLGLAGWANDKSSYKRQKIRHVGERPREDRSEERERWKKREQILPSNLRQNRALLVSHCVHCISGCTQRWPGPQVLKRCPAEARTRNSEVTGYSFSPRDEVKDA